MYVKRLKIRDIRAFKEAEIELLYPGREKDRAYKEFTRWPPRMRNVNVFLGNNGSGKSTILDCFALALISPIVSSSGYRPDGLIRRSTRTTISAGQIDADVLLHRQDGADGRQSSFRATVKRRGSYEILEPITEFKEQLFYEDEGSAFFLVGYGASRRTEALSANDLAARRKQRAVRYERVASLFEDHFALTPLASWLPSWRTENPGRYRQVVNLLQKLLPPAIKFSEEMENGDYLFTFRRIKVPYTSLSDGYRTYLGWVSDLLFHLCMGSPSGFKLVESRGVVLVDEIDLHIHPAWQRTIIPTLSKTFKNIQFIFTTHSPLVVSTLERANIYNVQWEKTLTPKVSRPTEETFGLSADQLLRSEVFGLDSTRDPEFTQQLRDLSDAAARGRPGAALAYLRSASGGGAEETPSPQEAPDWLKAISERGKSS